MSSDCYDDIQMTFFRDLPRHQTVDQQRLIAEARHAQSRELARLARKGVDFAFRPLVRLQRRVMLQRQLAALDDHMLEDIGIRRADIATLVATAYPLWSTAVKETAVAATIHRLAVAARDRGTAGDLGDHRPLAA